MYAKSFFDEWLRLTIALKDGEKSRLIDAVANFAKDGTITELNGKEACLFPVFCNFIEEELYDERIV